MVHIYADTNLLTHYKYHNTLRWIFYIFLIILRIFCIMYFASMHKKSQSGDEELVKNYSPYGFTI